jgi:hypothetical protein
MRRAARGGSTAFDDLRQTTNVRMIGLLIRNIDQNGSLSLKALIARQL